METSLLEAERTSNISKLASLKNDSVNLRRQEAEIEQKLKIRKSEASVETVVVRFVKLALNNKCTFFTHGHSRDIQKRKALS